ncbi:unnamed protein product, partial [Hapterophycus canaliculatus]
SAYRGAGEGPSPAATAPASATTTVATAPAPPAAPQIDDYHRPLPLAADPPVGAPLRPRHHVCRDRLSAAAAAALLRGAGGGGGGWRGGAVVTFAGSSGAGKACLAAEVVGRRDVRAKFGDGVLWLQVGRSGGADLAAVLQRLAHAYHKVVLSRRLRQPPPLPPINRFRGPSNAGGTTAAAAAAAAAAAVESSGEDGGGEAAAATAVAVAAAASAEAAATAAASWFTPFMSVSGLGLRCLAVLEDVWDAEVVAAASAAGFDLVVTTAFR